MAEFEKQMNVKLESDQGFIPKDMEELEMYMEMSFKEAVEIAMEDVVNWTFYDNDWNNIKPRVIHDLVENNKGAIRIYWDENNNIRMRYCDIGGLITSYTDDPNYTDTEYEAEVHPMTIRDLRNMSNGKLTDEELFKIAALFANKLGNKDWLYPLGFNSYDWNSLTYTYDDYRIEVLDFTFYTTDINTYEEKSREDGRTYFTKKSNTYVKPERSKYDINAISKKTEQSYSGLWVIGTEYMAKYGRDKNITRPKREGRPSPKVLHKFIIVEPNKRYGTSNSFIDLIKPYADDIQLNILKIRHFVAEAVPAGMAIDINSLNSISTDGQKDWEPMKQVKLYKQKGIMIFNRMDDNGEAMNGKPFEFMVNGLGDGLRPFFDAINFQLSQIASTTGINEARDGSRPDSKALVGIQKLQIIASNNVTRELYNSFTGLIERSATVISRMVQDKVEFGGGIDQYIPIIGINGVQSIKFLPEDMTAADFGIKIEALPTGEDLQDMYNAINDAVAKGEIRYEDGLEIKSMTPKKAIKFLRWKKKKYQEETMNEMAQKEEMTMQREQAAVAASTEKEKIKQQAEAQKQIAVLEAEYKLKQDLDALATENLMKLERVKTEGKLMEIRLAAETNLKQTESPNPETPEPKVFPSTKF